MKKGRHRRFEEARALKRSTEPRVERCPECGAAPDDEHASWCLHEEVDDDIDGPDGDWPSLDAPFLDGPSLDRPDVTGPNAAGPRPPDGEN